MKIKLRVQISGTRNGQVWPVVGTIVDLPDDEAVQLVRNGTASACGGPVEKESEKPAEKAPEKAPEKAAKPLGRPVGSGLTTKSVKG